MTQDLWSPRVRATGPGCTTAPAKLASGQPLSWTARQEVRRALEAECNAVARNGREVVVVVVVVTNSRLDFGTWERILCQLDG